MGNEVTQMRLRPLLSGVVLRSQSDARLAQLAGEGHQLAFSTIFERYERELAAHAARVVQASRAEDIVQHAMLNAWSALLSGEVVAEPRAWLHRIVHNIALNTVARRGYDDSAIPEMTASPILTDEIAEGRMSAAEALAAVAALPDAQRRALTLTALGGRSGTDAAAELGVSETAVRQLVYRARQGVRSALSAVTPMPLIISALNGAGAGAAAAAAAGGAATAGALSGVAAKTAVVLAVAAGGAGATAVLSNTTENHPRARHAQTTARTATTPVAPVSIAEPPPAQALRRPARSRPRTRPGGSQGGDGRGNGSHGASGENDADGNHGAKGNPNTNDRSGSNGARSGPSDPALSDNSDTSTPEGAQGSSTTDSGPPAPSTIHAPLQPDQRNTSTSQDSDAP